ncbi:hypothetical protein Tco_0090749 [Tanacetum coccineum]
MSNPKFAETHNLVAFLEKPEESDGFKEIIDFLNACYVQYALTVNPTIYTTCIEQFWAFAKAKIVNEERQIQALVNKKKVIITETSIRSDLKLDDAEGIDCLPTATIFAKLERMAWNEFSSTMASTIICLATNQIFNFSKYIFDNMVKHLEGGVKFLMYSRFVQVFLDKQVEGITRHKEVYVTPSHTKKVFANMKRPGKFYGRVTPLFPTMMIQASEDMGEDSADPSDSYSTPIISQPSSSKPQKKSRRKQRKESGATKPVTDEAHVSTPSYDPPQSGEDRDFLLKEESQEIGKEKIKSYDESQEMFDKEMKRVNTFVDMNKKLVKSSETRTEGSSKRAGDELVSDKSKKQKLYEHVEAEKDDQEEDIDREDLETLWKLVKDKHENTRPEEDYERVLWGDLKVMFEPDIKSDVWRNLQGYKVTV